MQLGLQRKAVAKWSIEVEKVSGGPLRQPSRARIGSTLAGCSTRIWVTVLAIAAYGKIKLPAVILVDRLAAANKERAAKKDRPVAAPSNPNRAAAPYKKITAANGLKLRY